MSNESVWESLYDDKGQIALLRTKSMLMMAVRKWVKVSILPPEAIALALHIDQDRLTSLLGGEIDLFSADDLIVMAGRAEIKWTLGVGE